MNSTMLSVATMLVAALIASPATAYADCGDLDQPPCTRPVPSDDDAVAILAKLTDPDIPAANKSDIVTPGFAPDEAQTIDDHLNRLNASGYIPLNFSVTDIQPAPNNFAGATVHVSSGFFVPRGPIVLVDKGGRWSLTHDTATVLVNRLWYDSTLPHLPWMHNKAE
jgi:hypothetical protein